MAARPNRWENWEAGYEKGQANATSSRPFKFIAMTWLTSISGILLYTWNKNPHLSASQKVIHARVYAQGITVAAMIATAGVGMFTQTITSRDI